MAVTQDGIIKVLAGMFNAAAGGYYNDMYFGYRNSSLQQMCIDLSGGAFKSIYPTYYNGTQFANAFLTQLLSGYSSSSPTTAFAWARDWISARYNAGEAVGTIVYDTIMALDGASTTDADWGKSKQLLDNKTAVARYYTIDLGGTATSLSTLQAFLSGVTYDDTTVDNAISLIRGSGSISDSDASVLNYSNALTSVSIPLYGIGNATTLSTLDIASGSSLATVNLITSNSASYVKLENSAAAPITSMKISGTKDLTLDLSDPRIASAITIDASTLEGALTLTLNATVDKDFTITGTAKNDVIDMGRKLTATDTINGKAGTNTLKVEGIATHTTDSKLLNIQTIELTSACELNVSGQTENFTIKGSASTDIITSGSGNDIILAGDGNDIIKAGGGSDTITTGNGADIVIFEATYATNIVDTITDFTYGSDKLDFSLFLVTSSDKVGLEAPVAAAVSITTGLDMTGFNVGAIYGVKSGEISKINISTTTGANKITIADNKKAVILAKESDTSSVCNVYYVEDTDVSTTVQNWSVKLVGILQNNSSYSTANMIDSVNFY